MIYVTTRQNNKEKQISWLDIINETAEMNMGTSGSPGTITRCYEETPERLMNSIYLNDMIETLERFNASHENLFKADRKTLYRHFCIPKKKGGLRPIDQPCAELQFALSELVFILKEKFGLLHHTAAFAYVNGRSTVQFAHKHQVNESNFFYKTDCSGFFPNTNLSFTMKMLKMIFPLSEICKVERGEKALTKAISLAFLNDGLPQGTTLSPMLTNLIMIPIDYKLFNELAHKRYVYTRYADDIVISCVQKIDKQKMTEYVENVLREFGAPWVLKPDKTFLINNKACTPCWILGVMLNKDNNITVGHKRKREFKGMTNNLILDYKNGKRWSAEDIQYYAGILSYYKMVEKEYFDEVLKRFQDKYGVKVKTILKSWNYQQKRSSNPNNTNSTRNVNTVNTVNFETPW